MFLQMKKIYEIMTVVVVLLLSGFTWAADTPGHLKMQEPEELRIIRGKSIVLTASESIKRVSIGDPDIADFILISPTEIYVVGKSVGGTSITLWKNKEHYDVYNIVVSINISQLKKKLHEILPDEKDLYITSDNDHVTLYGRVTSAVNMNRILALTKAYVPGEKINNLMEVSSVNQVMLEVRIAEMQRSLMRKLGINFDYVTSSGNFGINKLVGLTELVGTESSNLWTGVPGVPYADAVSAPFGQYVSPSVNALFRFNAGGVSWTGFIDALKSDGLIKILAEPTLTALSGQEASFLAGGEFPVPAPQGLGTVAIDYKSFGVGLTFKPIVLGGGKINIDVAPEVSELDFTTAVQFSGFVVPGLTTRKSKTVVELADGQSFAIAGLLKETVRDAVDKIPLLGEIPVLGALFRSRAYQTNETELVIIVTPHLVKPLDMDEQTFPTDDYTEPNDLEFYLLGHMKGNNMEPVEEKGITGELDGSFGHAIPGRE